MSYLGLQVLFRSDLFTSVALCLHISHFVYSVFSSCGACALLRGMDLT